MTTMFRTRWAAIGAAVAVTLGAGGIGLVGAAKGTGERSVYTAIEPCRLLDTRPNHGVGGRTAPLGPGEIYQLTAHGDNGQCEDIPNDTLALELNVTGLLNTAATDFVIWSGAGAPPNASQLNLALGAPPTPNSVTTELDGPNFSIRNKFGNAHVIIDIVGIYQDHHHDDRYYTETEVDAALDKTKYLNLQTLRNVGGLDAELPYGGPLQFETSLVVPPDYTSGTDMLLRLHILKLDFPPVAACTIDLDPNGMYMLRPSTGQPLDDDGGTVSDGLENPAPISFDAVSQQVRTIDIVVSQPGTIPIEPGDSVTLGFLVNSSTCNGFEVGVHSAALYYD